MVPKLIVSEYFICVRTLIWKFFSIIPKYIFELHPNVIPMYIVYYINILYYTFLDILNEIYIFFKCAQITFSECIIKVFFRSLIEIVIRVCTIFLDLSIDFWIILLWCVCCVYTRLCACVYVCG